MCGIMEQMTVAEHIERIVEQEVPVLESLTEEVVDKRFNGQKRNIKMLLGHMVDSASNNQQRMVRLQYAPRADGLCLMRM